MKHRTGISLFRHLATVMCGIVLVLSVCALTLAIAGEAPAAAPPTTAAPAAATPATTAPATKAPATPAGPEIDLTDMAPSWGKRQFFGIAVWQYLTAFIFVLIGLALKKISDHLFKTKIIPLLKRTPFDLDHLVAHAAAPPVGWLLLLLGLYGAFGVMTLPREPNVHGFVFGFLKILLTADILWFLFRLVDIGDAYLTKLAGRTDSTLDDQLVPVIRKALKVTIALIGFVWAVQLLGYSVSSLLAGLGIGGLAVALALQDTLANFFGSVFIFLDRPFVVGDWVKVGDTEGFVEEVGFRSTRIRTLPTTLVSIPNKHVADSSIDNLSKMPKRRVLQTVGVTYETTADQMVDAVAAIRDIVATDDGVHKETIVVRFQEFGGSSLDILVLYFTNAIPLPDHLETKERVNLAIMRKLADMGLDIAFPTQTIYFEGDIARQMAAKSAEHSA